MTGMTSVDQPIVDEQYDVAMDRLAAADCERGDAAIAVDRERRTATTSTACAPTLTTG
jgi:hypothetical protein